MFICFVTVLPEPNNKLNLRKTDAKQKPTLKPLQTQRTTGVPEQLQSEEKQSKTRPE
jgi:hypothetical protein